MLANRASAQQDQPFKISGKVVDKVHKNTLNAATISVFDADSNVVSFQISNTYGDFTFNIPKIKYPVQVRFSNIGYNVRNINFNKYVAEPIELGNVDLIPSETGIETVEIRVAPVTMNGDTLEFNPQAFKLDSNAVLDDFLRKIPNVTIWGDGQITVNGKEIKSLVVNGQPFFGTDFKVALGNLPKDAIQKVQVYKQESRNHNMLDSLLEMNVKLKADMDHGYFGKFSAGTGTNDRYDLLGNINYFTRKLQVSLTSTYNNINKIANNNKDLIAVSTYKASSVEGNYQSNFSLPNENIAFSTGLTVNYNFLDKPNPNLRNRLSAEYFRKRLNVEEGRRTVSLITLAEQQTNNEIDLVNRDGISDEGLMQLSYNYNDRINNLSIQSSRLENRDNYESLLSTMVDRMGFGTVSTYKGNHTSDMQIIGHNLSVNYQYSPNLEGGSKFIPFELGYQFNNYRKEGREHTNTQFLSFVNPSQNIAFNRNIDLVDQTNHQQIELKVPNILGALRIYVLPFNVSLNSNYTHKKNRKEQLAMETIDGKDRRLDYLSNISEELLKRLEYGVNLSKSYEKRLTDRFERALSFSVEPLFTKIDFDVASQNTQQNMQKKVDYFTPKANIRFTNNLFGKTRYSTVVSFNTELNYPTLQEIMPLVDSTQVYQLRFGNSALSGEKIFRYQLQYDREYFASANTLSYILKVGYDYSNSKISDSLEILPDNRQRIWSVNVADYANLFVEGQLKKAFKFKKSNLQLVLNGSLSKRILPTFINRNLVSNEQRITNLSAVINYSWNDLVSVELKESAFLFRSKQPFFEAIFSGNSLQHVVNLGYRIKKSVLLNTDLNLYTNKTSSLPASNFTIWNVHLSQRLMKQQNVELKLSAQDLLRQNKSIVNTIGVNRFVTRYQNSLQNYFLLSISYYPRKFGN